ncbi:hypothetical protein [Microvirga yunnanensis]|uniref:hypothetical protein n=1 Tax=Microvirga yunnanensis TaxID=2953740 RepID=UPI0021C8D368|nr:hypothetical protein [Microvirga sp. HBU65207]
MADLVGFNRDGSQLPGRSRVRLARRRTACSGTTRVGRPRGAAFESRDRAAPRHDPALEALSMGQELPLVTDPDHRRTRRGSREQPPLPENDVIREVVYCLRARPIAALIRRA